MTVMSVAHQVDAQDDSRVSNIMTEDDLVEDPANLAYSGPSPDEVTLVEFARERGFSFLSRNDTVARISIDRSKVVGDVRASRLSHNGSSSLTTYNDASQVQQSHLDLMEFDQSNSNIRHRTKDDGGSGTANTMRFRRSRPGWPCAAAPRLRPW